jgi:hypothetical protein
MEALTTLAEVKTQATRNGNIRFVARDADGHEYTTFREEIGTRAQELEGRSVRLTYHEEKRGQYNNVYLDEIEPVTEARDSCDEPDVQEAAWRTAVEAAPWLLGKPEAQVQPEELYEKLKPFEERVAQDIEESRSRQ